MTVYIVLECFAYEPGSVRVVGVYESADKARDVAEKIVIGEDGVKMSRWVEEGRVVIQ